MRAVPLLILFIIVAAACGSSGETSAGSSEAAPDGTGRSDDSVPVPSSDTTVASTDAATTAPATTTAIATTTSEPAATDATFYDTDADALFAFLDTVPDEPFFMVNVVRHRAEAVYEDGRTTDLTGAEADGIYTEFMRSEMLPSIGAEIVWAGQIERDLIGGGEYETIGIVRYPSGDAFRGMVQDPRFEEMLPHKRAGVEDTITLATRQLDTPALPPTEDPPFPATDDDLPFAFVHVLDYREVAEYAEGDEDADPARPGEDAVGLYTTNAGIVAAPLGVRPVAWFDVAAVVSGDPGWEEVRINAFPSHATFEALTSDPTWQAGSHHRTAGLAKTHAFMTSPVLIDELRP